MKRSFGPSVLVVACAVGCGGGPNAGDPAASSSSSIQGGATDATHAFAVGIAQLSQLQQHQVVFCSGALLAPNLVATARHCVVELASPQIQCSSSTFGSPLPPSDVRVTADAQITPTSDFAQVRQIIEPTGLSQSKVCGNDIALLILDRNIDLPQYVAPTIGPPMTDPSYATSVTTIGYGVDTPTDDAGATAGVRRILENVGLRCVPNDSAFNDCLSGGTQNILTATEFESGVGSTCEGDSGSSAFEQRNFDAGRWVSFGVLSRGGLSPDGKTCIEPVYERFDAWGQFLIDAAKSAASAGGYSPPAWVNEQPIVQAALAQAGGCTAAAAPGPSVLLPWRLVGVAALGLVLLAVRRSAARMITGKSKRVTR
ncbi:MAG TPA: trypsin-like serine protease [Polyangiaceae bacterium]|nr:trypsin-like serine protease [Polyangiaceae bacterium]